MKSFLIGMNIIAVLKAAVKQKTTFALNAITTVIEALIILLIVLVIIMQFLRPKLCFGVLGWLKSKGLLAEKVNWWKITGFSFCVFAIVPSVLFVLPYFVSRLKKPKDSHNG